jgi:hypothetical protein
MRIENKFRLNYILILLVVADLVFSFVQHKQLALDGDMAGIIVPSKSYETVLHDPFGMNVLLYDSVYAAPNRYFIHAIMKAYFTEVPKLFQGFIEPIESVYIAAALIKTIIQTSLLLLITAFVCLTLKTRFRDYFLVMIILSPLFQTFGYHGYMGIIDHSITYTFFYGLSSVFALAHFLIWYKNFISSEKRISPISLIISVFLIIIIGFSGPLNPAVMILGNICLLLAWLMKKSENEKFDLTPENLIKRIKQIPLTVLLITVFAMVVSLISFYIGRNNSENLWQNISIAERYLKLPAGLFYQFTTKPGPALLLLVIILNTIWINRLPNSENRSRIIRIIRWTTIFAVIFILLLPLGGYREYRPNIIRRDSIQPVLLVLLFLFTLTNYYLLKEFSGRSKKIFIVFGSAIIMIFTFADAQLPQHNACEKEALQQLSKSDANLVMLQSDCTVVSWNKITNPTDSELNVKLLQLWGIVKKEIQYYQQ